MVLAQKSLNNEFVESRLKNKVFDRGNVVMNKPCNQLDVRIFLQAFGITVPGAVSSASCL